MRINQEKNPPIFDGFGFLIGGIKPDKKCKIGGKCGPQKVGNLQKSCRFIDTVKLDNHKCHKDQKKNNPYKSKQKRFHIKEDYWPQKVHEKLEPINQGNTP